MKRPEHSLYREDEIEKINLRDGETVYFDGQKIRYDDHFASMNYFAIGKNGPELRVLGGPCAIVTLYETKDKIGAVLHIGTGDIDITGHRKTKQMINKLLQALGDLPSETTDVNVFVDVEDYENLPGEARLWCQTIVEESRNHFSRVDSFTREIGKDVRLNTGSGELRVFDNDHKLIFSKGK